MKKIIYMSVLSGAVIFHLLFIFSFPVCSDITCNPDCSSCHFADNLPAGGETASLATGKPYFICLFSISESGLTIYGASAVPAGSRDPPVF
ncbi:MAG: hypothetical protein P8013_10540 [Candidatus Sulfobium sp.]|jgi:hypothetical protein